VFSFYKFRTMHVDARVRFPEMYAYRYTREQFLDMLLKTPDDPRLTRLGRKLRTTSLDELPNLVNVLRGDMSLVGPRPELPDMVRYYTEEELSKFSVRPGVTGALAGERASHPSERSAAHGGRAVCQEALAPIRSADPGDDGEGRRAADRRLLDVARA